MNFIRCRRWHSAIARGDFVDIRRGGRTWQGLVIGSNASMPGKWEMINYQHISPHGNPRKNNRGEKKRQASAKQQQSSNGPIKPIYFDSEDIIYRIPQFCQKSQEAGDKDKEITVDEFIPLMDGLLRTVRGIAVGSSDKHSLADWPAVHGKLLQLADPADYSIDLLTASTIIDSHMLPAADQSSSTIDFKSVHTITAQDFRLYITLNRLLSQPLYFIPLKTAATGESNTLLRFICRHPSELKDCRELAESFRQRDSFYSQFFHKLHQLLVTNKTPDVAKPPPPQFDQQERRWIDALLALAASDRQFGFTGSAYGFLARAFLGPLYYETDYNGLSRLLTDLGVWRPWDCLSLVPVIHASPDTWRSRNRERSLYRQSLATVYKPDGAVDSCESIRQDFGQSTAYSIDEFSVGEVDDALSVDMAGDGDPWIHIHIADPTALISTGSGVAEYARSRAFTTYLAERSLPMIPSGVAHKLAGSLEPDNSINRTLTISVKINQRGEVYDYLIRPGVLGKLMKLMYGDVDRWLQSAAASSLVETPFGKPQFPLSAALSASPSSTTLTAASAAAQEYLDKWRYPKADLTEQMQTASESSNTFTRQLSAESTADLQILEHYAYLHYRQRSTRSISLSLPSAAIHLQANHPLNLPHAIGTLPRPDHHHPPVIQLSIEQSYESTARQMVQEYMIIAGWAVADYASRRGLPLPYRTQSASIASSAIDELLLKTSKWGGDKLLPSESFRFLPFISPSALQSRPAPHFMLGLDHYCQSTSPLRRYSDLLVHWQLKNRLLMDHQNQSSVAKPLFAETEIKDQLKDISERERTVKRLQQLNSSHWIREYMRQSIDDKTGHRCYDAFVLNRTPNGGYSVFLKQLAHRSFINEGEYHRTSDSTDRSGEWMRVRVSHLDRYNNPVLTEVY